MQDLKAAMPELGRGLQQLLDFDGNVEGTFARSFEVCEGPLRALVRSWSGRWLVGDSSLLRLLYSWHAQHL